MQEHEKKELEKMEKLLATAEGHPMMKALMAEKAAAILATRTEAAGKIEALKKEQGEVIPKLQAKIEAKEKKYLEAKTVLDTALNEVRTARAELSSEGCSFDSDIRHQEAILIESSDPRIDETIQYFRDRLDDLRKPGKISSRGMNVERNLVTDTKTVTVESNADAVLGALAYCQAAIKGLEALKLSPDFHIEGIQELKDALPSLEVYQEVSGEKPLPGSKGVNPRHLLKSDSETEWSIGRLNENFKKLMGR